MKSMCQGQAEHRNQMERLAQAVAVAVVEARLKVVNQVHTE